MSSRTSVTANADYTLSGPSAPEQGRLSVAWGPLGGATVQLLVRHNDYSGNTLDVPVANGKVTAASVDSQSTLLQSINIEARGTAIIARITGYSAPFDIWVS